MRNIDVHAETKEENIIMADDRTAWREISCAAEAGNIRTDDAN